ncbi:MAG: YeiH family protein [Planctomyces sp.]
MSRTTEAIVSDDRKTSPAPPQPAWWQNEDYLAVIAAAALIGSAVGGWKIRLPALKWSSFSELAALVTADNLTAVTATSGVVLLTSILVLGGSLRGRVLQLLPGAALILSFAWLAQVAAANTSVKAWGLEYVIFALAIGLLWSHVLPVPSWLAAGIRTEFFIKIGIVILGCGVVFSELLKAGMPGLIQAVLVIPVVWHFTFRLARWLKVDDEFAVMLSTAVSICGVSAAIAACGAIQGDRKKLSYTTSIVLLCAVPMMIVMPWLVRGTGLSDEVGGAWLGGTLDTSGSVLAATEMVSETASRIGTVVKLSQNVLIGFAAFLISLWWSYRERSLDPNAPAPTAGVIWERFPKFVLGFIGASLLFSFIVTPEKVTSLEKPLKGLRELFFAAAFVSIGMETRFGDLFRLGGGRPAFAFLGGQLVNILWTLILAWILFGVLK